MEPENSKSADRLCGNSREDCYKTRLHTFISLILIVVLGFVVYANSLNGEFLWDDDNLVKENVYIRDFSNVRALFTKNIRGGLQEKISMPYRPMQMLTYMLDHSIWKLDVRGYHITNTILHILAALSIYWLINILYDNRFLSLATAMLFVAHPIHTEAVSYISGRADPLAALFIILSLIFYIKHTNREDFKIYILSLLSYILALLSRENAIILPALILLYHYISKTKIRLKYFIPLLSITIAYIALRLTALSYLLPHISSNSTLFERIPGLFVAIVEYIRLLFIPTGLHMEYGNKVFAMTYPKIWLGIVITLILLAYCVKKKRSIEFFGISWFFITLIPSANIYPVNAYMAEHWLYIPSIGFFLIISAMINRLYKSKNLKIAALLVIIFITAIYSSLTISQNRYWQKPLRFYE
ncbi:MAG: hypothetical protein ABH843_00495, partial [Candidatus Omnitrophota bacterium]